MANQTDALNAYSVEAFTAFATKDSIDQTIHALETRQNNGQITEDEKKKLESLRITRDNMKPTSLDTFKSTMSIGGIGASVVQKASAALTIPPSPSLKPNTVEVKFIKIKDNDLVSFIDATVNLNPWGRMRQCDEDLKNLMGIIGKDINNEIGEWLEVTKQVSQAGSD